MSDWTPDDTERWLSDYPLPRGYVFPPLRPGVAAILEHTLPAAERHRANQALAWPEYTAKKGYGFWLRTAGPYHRPLRGAFALAHEILAAIPVGAPMPTPDQLAEKMNVRALGDAELPFTTEDNAPARAVNPAAGDPLPPDTGGPTPF